MSAVELRGSSWNHERGHAPMVATASEYEQMTGGTVRVRWEPRSLKEFGTSSVAELSRRYDLVVMDHPHIGLVAETGCAVPIDEFAEAGQLQALAAGSPGRSHASYHYGGHQWGLAIDAACQVSARRPDLLPESPQTWDDVIELSREGRVLWPLGDVDSAASMLTLMAGLGSPISFEKDAVVDCGASRRALEIMREVARASDSRCLHINPIDALEVLSGTNEFWYAPLIFGYVNYSRRACQGAQVTFGDIPIFAASRAPVGSLLGGSGIMVSAYSAHRGEAISYALHVAAPVTQRTTYFAAGGQPAHHEAWSNRDVDEAAGGFFSGTGRVMEASWTRPRIPSFVGFQNEMIDLFGYHEHWMARPATFIEEFEALYRRHSHSGTDGEDDQGATRGTD